MSQEKQKPSIEIPKPWLYKGVRYAAKRFLLNGIELTSSGIENVPYEGGVSAEANHRNDDFDVPAAGIVLGERRAAFYPAKSELDKFPKGWFLKNCGALFFIRGDRQDGARVRKLASKHISDGHLVLTFIEGGSKNTGAEMGKTLNSATRNAIENDLDEVLLVGIGGTDTPFRTDEKGLAKRKREKPERIHIEIGKVSIFDALAPYRQAEKPLPAYVQKDIHNDIVVPALQTIVDIAYDIAA